MPGPMVLAMARRLVAYQGVMRERAAADLLAEAPAVPSHQPASPAAEPIPVTPATVAADPVMSQIFSFG
jgi:hypothetical protein